MFNQLDTHLLEDAAPSTFINEAAHRGAFIGCPFHLLLKLEQTEQSKTHHPEGNVWNHTMMVVDQAAAVKERSRDKRAFMWAALLHDIGKPDTTRNRKGKITAYDHDKLGAELARKFLEELTTDLAFIDQVSILVRWHMQILFVVNDLPFADIESMKSQIAIEEIALLGLCDRLGRLNPDKTKEENNIKIFIEKCNAY